MEDEPDPASFVYVAISGERTRGGPGVVWVDRDSGVCRYLLVTELVPEKLRTGIEQVVARDDGTNYIIVVKDGAHVHVMTHSRKLAHEAVVRSVAIREASPPALPSPALPPPDPPR